MSGLNRFLKALNQNRSLREAAYPVEMNRDFLPVIGRQQGIFERNLNLCVKWFHASSLAATMMTHRA